MAFKALKRIRFGDGFLEAGADVPVEPGRRYDMMVRSGDVVEVPDTGHKKVDDTEDLGKRKRDELNKLAADAGVEDPGSLPNKDAVIEAVETREHLDSLSRAELDKRAEDLGIAEPGKLPNKGAVIDAILAE